MFQSQVLGDTRYGGPGRYNRPGAEVSRGPLSSLARWAGWLVCRGWMRWDVLSVLHTPYLVRDNKRLGH